MNCERLIADKIFVETVGGGLFAEAIREAERDQQDDDDKVELGLRVLRRLVDELPTQPWRLGLDGVEHHGRYLAVEAMVIGETGPRVPLAPAARPRTGTSTSSWSERRIGISFGSTSKRDSPTAPEPSPSFDVHRCLKSELEPLAPTLMRVDDEPGTHRAGSEREAMRSRPSLPS